MTFPSSATCLPEIDLDTLDPGIRVVVYLLRDKGFDTTESGDGVTKAEDARTFTVPHVVVTCSKEDLIKTADQLSAFLVRHHKSVGPNWRIEASYCPTDASVVILCTKARATA